MADIFVSYKREEREEVERLVLALKGLGLDVWFDASLSAGEAFSDEINREVRAAKAVLVCWSPAAASSSWVKAEAQVGFTKQNLISTYISGPDGFEPPVPYNNLHMQDMRAWAARPSARDTSFLSVLRSVGRLAGRVDIAEWAALGADATVAQIDAWFSAHPQSPLVTEADAFLREREAADRERAAAEEAARQRLAREAAERAAAEQQRRAEEADRLRREEVERAKAEAEARRRAEEELARQRRVEAAATARRAEEDQIERERSAKASQRAAVGCGVIALAAVALVVWGGWSVYRNFVPARTSVQLAWERGSHTFDFPQNVQRDSVSFSEDSKRLAISKTVVDVSTGQTLFTAEENCTASSETALYRRDLFHSFNRDVDAHGAPQRFAVSLSSSTNGITDAKGLVIYRLKAWCEEFQEFEGVRYPGTVVAKLLSPDGPLLGSSSQLEMVSQDGARAFAVSEAGRALLWDVATNQVIAKGQLPDFDANNATYATADLSRICIAKPNRAGAFIWSPQDGRALFAIESDDHAPCARIMYSRDKRHVFIQDGTKRIRMLDAADGREVRRFTDLSSPLWVFFGDEWTEIKGETADGCLVAMDRRTNLRFINTRTGKVSAVLHGEAALSNGGHGIYTAVMSANGTRLAVLTPVGIRFGPAPRCT